MMLKTYAFRLYPTPPQEEKLLWTLDQCRFAYNKLLEGLHKQQKLNRNELQHSLLDLKEQHPDLNKVYSKTLQYENHRLFSNLKALKKRKEHGRKNGKLRFKGKNWFNTFTCNQSGFGIIKNTLRYDKLHLAKIGDIPFILHREIEGTIKQITIKHASSGKWFALITAEQRITFLPTTNQKKVGIDLGLMNYVADSDSHCISHPKYLQRSLGKLKTFQKILSRKKKGSKNKNKARIKVARIYEHIVNQRNDFLHKLSHYYANHYGFIAVENLNITGLIYISYNARSLMDASWSRFIQMLCYKAERAGSVVMKVEPKGTSQQCSQCGTVVPKKLWDRIHQCTCGLTIDRDINAARNILQRALGQELPDVMPVEIRPLPLQGQVRSMKQDAQRLNAE